jgi:hypothetical protein
MRPRQYPRADHARELFDMLSQIFLNLGGVDSVGQSITRSCHIAILRVAGQTVILMVSDLLSWHSTNRAAK